MIYSFAPDCDQIHFVFLLALLKHDYTTGVCAVASISGGLKADKQNKMRFELVSVSFLHVRNLYPPKPENQGSYQTVTPVDGYTPFFHASCVKLFLELLCP